jgi:hypothetical protein
VAVVLPPAPVPPAPKPPVPVPEPPVLVVEPPVPLVEPPVPLPVLVPPEPIGAPAPPVPALPSWVPEPPEQAPATVAAIARRHIVSEAGTFGATRCCGISFSFTNALDMYDRRSRCEEMGGRLKYLL